jgi:hypothetical protein
LADPSQTRKSRTQTWIERRAEQNRLKDPSQTRIAKIASWLDRRQEKALDKAPVGTERLVGPLGSRYLYGPHGWEDVGVVEVRASGGTHYAIRYRKVRDADPVAVAELHRRLGLKP